MSGEGDAAARLRALLEGGKGAWPSPIEHHAVLGSTSDRLKDWARAGAPDLAVVLADAQVAGRGRQGKTWTSPPGNLYVSVLLRPRGALAGLVPLLGGVAACTALVSLGVKARLKWPNDVLVLGPPERKIAGILAEASSGPKGVEWVALGIGVNVDPQEPLPAGATSVREETGQAFAPVAVAAEVLGELRLWYHRQAAGPAHHLLAAWRERSIPWWGRLVEAPRGDQVIRGIATDIDHDGALLLELPGGQVLRVVSGEVSRVRLVGDAPSSDRVAD